MISVYVSVFVSSQHFSLSFDIQIHATPIFTPVPAQLLPPALLSEYLSPTPGISSVLRPPAQELCIKSPLPSMIPLVPPLMFRPFLSSAQRKHPEVRPTLGYSLRLGPSTQPLFPCPCSSALRRRPPTPIRDALRLLEALCFQHLHFRS